MKIIFKVLTGSRAYGTSTPDSDSDYKGVYIQPINDHLKINGYKEQINVTKDETYYELKRFLELCANGNPGTLEMLFSPKDCIIEMHPIFEEILNNKHMFLTQVCKNSFGKYGISQIKKAKGLDKKFNYEKDRKTKKTPLDFCYIVVDDKSMPLKKYLINKGLKQENCGLSKINNVRDGYFLYHNTNIPYKGICGDDSNEVRLSSIPKEEIPIGIISFNKDAYSTHCKDYKSYQTWLKNRNEKRYVDTIKANQQIDSKNVMHCVRLLDIASEIATQKTINIKRENANYLLDIRAGKHDLDSLIEESNKRLEQLDDLYKNSGLPESCDLKTVNNILIKMRRNY